MHIYESILLPHLIDPPPPPPDYSVEAPTSGDDEETPAPSNEDN